VGGAAMTIRRFLLLLCLSIPLADPALPAQQSRFRVPAFYSDTTEPDHVQFARDAVKFFNERAAEEHFTFDATNKWEDLNRERLRDYQVVG
jgi:hypothetical protein